jgi:hypothetical protein
MWSWRRKRRARQPLPAPAPAPTPAERPTWADATTALYDTVDPVRPYVIRECDG